MISLDSHSFIAKRYVFSFSGSNEESGPTEKVGLFSAVDASEWGGDLRGHHLASAFTLAHFLGLGEGDRAQALVGDWKARLAREVAKFFEFANLGLGEGRASGELAFEV